MRICEPEPAMSTTVPIGGSAACGAAAGRADSPSSLKLLISSRNCRRLGWSFITLASPINFEARGKAERLRFALDAAPEQGRRRPAEAERQQHRRQPVKPFVAARGERNEALE